MSTFQTKTIRTWSGFLRLREQLQDEWVFRGQTKDWALKSSFERACDRDDVSLNTRSEIETELITDFRRRYDGKDRQIVNSDTLYCLALMQHHGAPTRLIDCTYSPFIALYFALESSEKLSVIWCIKQKQCLESAYAIAGEDVIKKRNCYTTRNDDTFLPLYMEPPLYNMVFLENPFFFNPRLNIQQGLFLCPGNICTSFEDNLKALVGFKSSDSVLKIKCQLNNADRINAIKELHRMNINRESLFPGLDGFAQSMGHRLWLYQLFNNLK